MLISTSLPEGQSFVCKKDELIACCFWIKCTCVIHVYPVFSVCVNNLNGANIDSELKQLKNSALWPPGQLMIYSLIEALNTDVLKCTTKMRLEKYQSQTLKPIRLELFM